MAIDARLLTVIKSINDLGVCTVVDIHRATGISRPAVHRIVNNLCEFGYTERLNGGSAIRLTAQILTLSAGYRTENQLAERVAPVLAKLQRRIRWPLTFATPDGSDAGQGMMIIQETTRGDNPFVFDNGRVGLRLPMPATAVGCAYLAHCAADARERILARWQDDCHYAGAGPCDMRFAHARYRIAQAADKGFCLRSGGEPERTTSIAVPLIVCQTAVGAICTSFPTSAVPLSEACADYAPELQAAARTIAASYEH